MRKASEPYHREDLTLLEVAEMLGDEEAPCGWIEELRWPNGPC